MMHIFLPSGKTALKVTSYLKFGDKMMAASTDPPEKAWPG